MKLGWFLFPSLLFLFWLFFKIGLVFFGGGYVIIPFIHRELVTNLHLLSEKEFIDGIAISQLTPGPVAVIATFAGFMISGVSGALVGTFAMFLPGSALMFFISKYYEKIKNSVFAYKVLNKIIPVITGLLVATAWQLGQASMSGAKEIIILFVVLLLLIRFKINPVILMFVFALTNLIFPQF
jgi:chromate transporter